MRTRPDGLREFSGLVVGEVTCTPSDAFFEERGPWGSRLQIRAVVAFDREDIHAAKVGDELLGGSSQIGSKAEGCAVGQCEFEGSNAELIMGKKRRLYAHTKLPTGKFKGLIEQQRAGGEEALALCAPTMGAVHIHGHMPWHGTDPGGFEVVLVQVREHDRADSRRPKADGFERGVGVAGTQAAVEQNGVAVISASDEKNGAVAPAA